MSDEKSPVLQRAALERVLLRAAELQASSADVPEALSEQELVSLADEVGITTSALKQALAEERMRVVLPEERGMLAALAGPAFFSAARVVPGGAKEVLERVDGIMQQDENLAVLRRFPDRIQWGPASGLTSVMRGITRLGGRGFPLVRADEVSATVVASAHGKVHVRAEATFAGRRARSARRGIVGAVIGALIVPALVAMKFPLVLAAVAGGGLAALALWLTRRSYRADAHAAQLAIEQLLDRLEYGDARKRTLLDQLLTPGTP